MTNYYQKLSCDLPQSDDYLRTMMEAACLLINSALDGESLREAPILLQDRAIIMQALRSPAERGGLVANLKKRLDGVSEISEIGLLAELMQSARLAVRKPGPKLPLDDKDLALILVALQCDLPNYKLSQFVSRTVTGL